MKKFFIHLLFLTLILFPFALSQVQAKIIEDDFLLGVKAREKGDYELAERHFADSAKKHDDYDSWYNLSISQGYQGKFSKSEESIKKAINVAPQDHLSDAKLMLARIYGWSKKYDQAYAIINELLSKSPNDSKIKLVKARLLFYERKYDQAQILLEQIEANQETNQESEQLSMLIAAMKDNSFVDQMRFRMTAGTSRAKFDHQRQSEWRNSFLNLNYKYDNKNMINFSYDHLNRYDDYSDQFGVGLDHGFSDDLQTSIGISHAANAEFMPEFSYKIGGAARVINNDLTNRNDLWLLVNLQKDDYEAGNSEFAKLGLQYFIGNALSITPKYIAVIDSGDSYSAGFSLRLDFATPINGLRIYAGYGDAPETQNAITRQTKSVFSGLAYDLNKRITLYGSFSQDDREQIYKSKTALAAIAVKF